MVDKYFFIVTFANRNIEIVKGNFDELQYERSLFLERDGVIHVGQIFKMR